MRVLPLFFTENSLTKINPRYSEVNVGETAHFYCDSRMSPVWIFHHFLLLGETFQRKFHRLQAHHLKLLNVNHYSAGEYVCVGQVSDKSFKASGYLKVFSK